jgi:thiamine pyrophosphate-dependent acetolactate synthase large subunit-like protein
VNPDFAAYAELCGGRGFRVAARDDLDGALTAALATEGPSLVHVVSDGDLV